MVLTDIKLAEVVTTGGTQSRVELSEMAVAEYGAAMAGGVALPPIVVFHDGSSYWLADGFHRVMAAIRAGIASLRAEVHKGTKRDAVLYSVGANAAHGLPRTNADKRRAVTMLLQDQEWSSWSNHEVARRCAVSPEFVRQVRSSLTTVASERGSSKTYTTKHGTTTTMNTENIGRKHGQAGARAEKIELIRDLASKGYRASQIAAQIELTEPTVRLYANEAEIELPDRDIGKGRKFDNRRAIEQTVGALEASARSLETVPMSFDGITPEQASEWAESVAESLRIYRKFHKQLQEASRV